MHQDEPIRRERTMNGNIPQDYFFFTTASPDSFTWRAVDRRRHGRFLRVPAVSKGL